MRIKMMMIMMMLMMIIIMILQPHPQCFVHVPTSAAKASTGISTPLFNFTMGMPTAPRVRVISTATHMAMECTQTIHREGIVLQGDLQETNEPTIHINAYHPKNINNQY